MGHAAVPVVDHSLRRRGDRPFNRHVICAAVKVLVTGGAGFIGSTVALACTDAGHQVVVLDDLSTGRQEFVSTLSCYVGDVADRALLERIVGEHPDITAVVHCAARIVVPESVADPLTYYDQNVSRTVALLSHLDELGIRRVLFSSSASVYASDDGAGVTEHSRTAPQSPYARTKLMVEHVLADAAAAGQFTALALRYFNPVGADPQLRSGSPVARPSHLMGQLLAAAESGSTFRVFGADWPTRDGTPIRDFIHVWDLAIAHVAALQALAHGKTDQPFEVLNVGTGRGTTVRELVDAFIRISGHDLRVEVVERRPGDSLGSFAVTDRAHELLGWRTKLTVDDQIRDAMRWNRRRRTWLGF